MLNKIVLPILISLSFATTSYASITECSTSTDILEIANQDSLVLFNLTDTLYVSTNTVGTADWRTYLVDKIHAWVPDEAQAEAKIVKIKRAIMTAMPKKLVEEEIPGVIESLQNQQIPTMGITQKPRTTPWIPKFDEFVSTILFDLGIDFRKTCYYFPFPPTIYANLGIIFKNDNSDLPESVVGFLYNAEPVRTVIVLDDCLSNLQKLEVVLEEAGIDFIGLRFNPPHAPEAEIDPILGIIQFDRFVADGSILSDGDALEIKSANPNADYESILKGLVDGF